MTYFNFSNYFIYLFIRFLSYSCRFYISKMYSEYFLSPTIKLILMFFGESIALFFYLYQYKYIKQGKNLFFVNFQQKKKNIYISFIICFCGLSDLLGSCDYQYTFSYSMKNISSKIVGFDYIILCLFVCINECYSLNIQIYNHQILGLILAIFPLIILFIINIDKNQQIQSFIFVVIIIIESKFILSMLYVIEKKLNYQYFININLLLFLEGIFGIFILLIYRFLYVFIFKMDNSFFIEIKNYKNTFELFLIFSLYSVLSFVYNFSRLRITELTRPSYNIIGNLFCFFFQIIITSIIQKTISKMDIIIFIISFFGFLIYCEFIILKFCNLDENTIYKTKIRAKDDFLSIQIELSPYQNNDLDYLFEH